jgi:hypothetical protein
MHFLSSFRYKPQAVLPAVAGLLFVAAACGETLPITSQVGDTYRITLTKESTKSGSNGSSATTHDKNTIIERVSNLRQSGGLELRYDFPSEATTQEKTSDWQFPAEVFKPIVGPTQLLNEREIEARIDRWLKSANLSRDSCGHWIFTWNAFRIECDPRSVLKTIQSYDLRSVDLHEGSAYQDPGASNVGTLKKTSTGPYGETFATEMTVDSDAVRRALAEQDVIVGEILKRPVTLETALHEHEAETIAGTISIVFDADLNGNVRRRTKVTKLDTKRADGRTETQSISETLERQLITQGH